MIRRPPRSTRTDTLFPYTTLFRSQLERDGLVERQVFAEVPPRVDYRLTPLGEELGETLCGLWMWAERHLCDVQQARETFDGQAAQVPRETAQVVRSAESRVGKECVSAGRSRW